MCLAPQRRAIFRHLTSKKWPVPLIFSTFWLQNVLRATAAWHFGTSELPKWLLHPQFFNILTSKCASRHSRVAFWNIGTSKMAPGSWCFVHFDLQMCFAPQRRAIFHLSARTATSAPAALARLLFEHQKPRIIEKTQRFATSLTFGAHVELLASDSTRMLIFLLVTWLMLILLLLTWLLCDSAFQLYILSEVRLLNFLRLKGTTFSSITFGCVASWCLCVFFQKKP